MSIFCCCYPKSNSYVHAEAEPDNPKETDPLMPPGAPVGEGSVGGTFSSSGRVEEETSPHQEGDEEGKPPVIGTPPPSHAPSSFTTPTGSKGTYEGGGDLSPGRPMQSTGTSRREEIPAHPPRAATPPPSHTPTQPTTPPANLTSFQGGGDLSPERY